MCSSDLDLRRCAFLFSRPRLHASSKPTTAFRLKLAGAIITVNHTGAHRRREIAQTGTLHPPDTQKESMRKLRVSFLHLAPVTCDIEHNRRLVERAVNVAADDGADWVITPELCIPGYLFMKQIGTDWITPQPGPWMEEFCKLVKKRNVSVFLSHPERDPATDKLYNTVFVINQEGHIVGKHSKIKALGGAESWSTAGTKIVPVECGGVQAGILICADAYKNEVAQALKDNGAELLVSPVSWGPGRCEIRRASCRERV